MNAETTASHGQRSSQGIGTSTSGKVIVASRPTYLLRQSRGLGYVFLSFAIFVGIWWAIASQVAPIFLPPPNSVGSGFTQLLREGKIQEALWSTLPVLAVALLAALVLGVVAGFLLGLFRSLDRITGPWVYVFWSTPIVALLPLIIITFGIGFLAAVCFIFLNCVFPIIMNTRTGVQQTDARMLEVARSLGARPIDRIVHVIIPAALPAMAAGFRIAVGNAVVGVIIAQLFISATGIGYMLQYYGETLQLDLYFGPLIVTAGIGVLLNSLADLIERRLVAWRSQG